MFVMSVWEIAECGRSGDLQLWTSLGTADLSSRWTLRAVEYLGRVAFWGSNLNAAGQPPPVATSLA